MCLALSCPKLEAEHRSGEEKQSTFSSSKKKQDEKIQQTMRQCGIHRIFCFLPLFFRCFLPLSSFFGILVAFILRISARRLGTQVDRNPSSASRPAKSWIRNRNTPRLRRWRTVFPKRWFGRKDFRKIKIKKHICLIFSNACWKHLPVSAVNVLHFCNFFHAFQAVKLVKPPGEVLRLQPMNVHMNLKTALHDDLCKRSKRSKRSRHFCTEKSLPSYNIWATVEVGKPKQKATTWKHLKVQKFSVFITFFRKKKMDPLKVPYPGAHTESMWVMGARTKFCHRLFLHCLCCFAPFKTWISLMSISKVQSSHW